MKPPILHPSPQRKSHPASTQSTEDLLRAFSQRLLIGHEAEREALALELHSDITQLLCAIIVRAEVLTKKISPQATAALHEVQQLRAMAGKAATAVEKISRDLHSSVLDHLGLTALVKSEAIAFAARNGLALDCYCPEWNPRLPLTTELTCYRILQETLQNMEQHAHAHHLTVHLTKQSTWVELVVSDDGVGFNPKQASAQKGLGLLGMSERARGVGGQVNIISSRGHGTTMHARFPTDTTRAKPATALRSFFPQLIP